MCIDHQSIKLIPKGSRKAYSVVPGHRNCQIEIAVWNWAGFFTEGLETCWQLFGQFLNDSYKPLSGIWPVSSLWV